MSRKILKLGECIQVSVDAHDCDSILISEHYGGKMNFVSLTPDMFQRMVEFVRANHLYIIAADQKERESL